MRITLSWKERSSNKKKTWEFFENGLVYEMHLGTKIDYLFFQSSRLFQTTKIQLLQNHCEQERTQILTKLMLSLESPRLAGYLLTGKRSMFLETDGSLAWLYHCPMVHSPLHTMSQCYDRELILYEGEIRFVDAITRQTYPDAVTQNCSDRIKKLFQFDMDQEDSWYTLRPGIVYHDKLAVFGPKNVTPMTAQPSITGSQEAGMYTRSELRGFWDSILINAASWTALKKFSQILLIYSTPQDGSDGFHYYTPRTEFYVNNMISPEYFKDRFMDTFGPVAYIFEHCGICFSVFLFLKLIIDLLVMIIRHMEINRMTGASLGFGKTLLSASYNSFLTSVMTSMYNPQASGLASNPAKKVKPRVDMELYEMRDDAKKKNISTQWLTPLHRVFLPFLYHLFNIVITLRIFVANHFSATSPFGEQWNSIYSRRSKAGIGAIHPKLPGSLCDSCFLISFPCFISFINNCVPWTTQRAI